MVTLMDFLLGALRWKLEQEFIESKKGDVCIMWFERIVGFMCDYNVPSRSFIYVYIHMYDSCIIIYVSYYFFC